MNIEPDHSVDAEDEEAVEFEADDLELEESEVEDPTTVGESRSREAAEAAGARRHLPARHPAAAV
jgi:hypothetical protein